MPNKNQAGNKEARSSCRHKFLIPEVPQLEANINKKANMGNQSAGWPSDLVDHSTQTQDSPSPATNSKDNMPAPVIEMLRALDSVLAEEVHVVSDINPEKHRKINLLNSIMEEATGKLAELIQAEQNPDGEPPAKRRKLGRTQDR